MCEISRPGQESTWIEPEMIDDYEKLHQMGIAHSIEAWQEDKQVGGLYGLAFGKIFLENQCFIRSRKHPRYVSLIFASLSQKYGVEMIDCQAHTPHLEKWVPGRLREFNFMQIYPVIYRIKNQ